MQNIQERTSLLGAQGRGKPGLLLCLAAAVSACGDGDPSRYDWSTLQSTLDSYVPDTVSGYVFNLGVSGDPQFTRAGGDLEAESVVAIASATKAPSAAAILTLVDLGVLDLDAPVGPYLEGQVDWPAFKSTITMRMLLNHTSGLALNPECISETVVTSMQQCVQEIADANLLFAPGTAFAYGGGSYQVAGYIATLLSGMSWNDFFDQALATPLNMPSYHFLGDDNPRVAGGGLTTAAEYAHIQQMVLAGGVYEGRRVLSEDMVALMSTDQVAGLPKNVTPLDEQDFPGYAFGWWISSPELHPGSAGPELSDPGLLGSVPWLDLDLGYSAVLLLQSNTDSGLEIWNATRPLIIDELAGQAAES